MENTNNDCFEKKVYICQNQSDAVRLDSTSGGVFSAISQYVFDRNGIVYGAEFDEKYRVVHGSGQTQDDLIRFRGSKYVQSHLGENFKSVKEQLSNDKWVLFTGTPCQVAGLNSYLGKKYEKLILMDIVCYSISSPGVWRNYLDHLQRTEKISLEDVKHLKFRDKSKYGYEYTLMTFYDQNNQPIYSSGPESNQMLRSFVTNTATRPSCYKCKFKSTERVSDFTVWDCYNVYQYDKRLDDNKGTSHIMVHTEKGAEILASLGDYLSIYEVDFQKAVDSEPAMTECASPSEMRDSFFSDYKSGNNVFEKFFPDTGRVKIERFLRAVLSKTGLYAIIKRCLKH